MTHKEVLAKLKEICTIEDDETAVWFPNGRNSVRVRSKLYGEFIFTYHSKKKWRLESVESFLDSIKHEVN